jgi:hypothetical protein
MGVCEKGATKKVYLGQDYVRIGESDKKSVLFLDILQYY